MEKQKTGRVEAMMREQRAAMEKELGGMQAKAQGSYQELQNMQMKVGGASRLGAAGRFTRS